MSEQGPENARLRIDRALARIEAAARATGSANADLLRRHDALRADVAGAIAALDSLIAESEAAD